ncbi:MAG: LPXTG cell wall anchor domain-containing protein [Bacteroidales bacterium]
MKKTVLILTAVSMLMASGMNMNAQDQPKPKKDTVNMDTYAKPEKYYDIEDEKTSEGTKSSNTGLIIGIAAGVVVLGGVGYFLTRKKK